MGGASWDDEEAGSAPVADSDGDSDGDSDDDDF